MPQTLKDHVRSDIAAAAVRVFARRGVVAATMAEIAAEAGISTGNIYRYWSSKEALFRDVVDERFVREFLRLLRRRVRALDGVADVRALDASHLYHLASARLLEFCIEHRLRVVILLGRSAGTPHRDFAERTVRTLIGLALAHFRGLDPGLKPTPALRFNLSQIYHAFVRTMVTVLAEFEDEATIRAIIGGYTRYHLAGLNALFDPASQPQRS